MSDSADSSIDRAAFSTQIQLLEEENERLREELSDAHRTRHRRAALTLALTGVLALVGGVLFPVARTVLIALGGTGIFASLLITYLTPERFVSATVGERVYEALVADRTALVGALGLRKESVYVPVETTTGEAVRLFVPQHADYELPEDDALEGILVTPPNERQRGVAFEPSGLALVDELEETVAGGFSDDPETLTGQLTDGLVETFELVDRATPEVDTADGRVSIVVSESAFGAVGRFDHPVSSLVASTLATELETPVSLDTQETPDGTVVTCLWGD